MPILASSAAGRGDEVAHADHAAILGRFEGRVDDALFDIAAGERQLPGEERNVDVLIDRRLFRKHACPDGESIVGVGHREVDNEAQAAQKGGVEILLEVGGEDGEAAIGLDPLQQIGDLQIGVAVVRVLHFRALAEQGVRLVEQENRARRFGGVEYAHRAPFRSRRYISTPSWRDRPGTGSRRARRAMICAAIVLPVPLGPANRAAMPWP